MLIDTCFSKLKKKGKVALIAYLNAGLPVPEKTVEVMHELVCSGCDVIELGYPFSDPVADGPVISRAHQQVLADGLTLFDVFDMVKQFRQNDTVTPVVLMGYLNPLEVIGYEKFVNGASDAGVDGLLVVDLPVEASDTLDALLLKNNMDSIKLVTPVTSDNRMKTIGKKATGYLYYVAVTGVTGSNLGNTDDVAHRLGHIDSLAQLPVVVGFGIKDGKSAVALGKAARGVVVGTALVEPLLRYSVENKECIDEMLNKVTEIRNALDGVL